MVWKNDFGVTTMAKKCAPMKTDRVWRGRSFRRGGARIQKVRLADADRADRAGLKTVST